MCIPRNAVCSACKQNFIWIFYTICGYIIQSVDILYILFIPVKWILSFLPTACVMGLLLGIAFGCFLLGLPRAPCSAQPCLPGVFEVGNHSLGLFSDPTSWQEGPNEASPTPGSWKNQRRPEDSALMSSGSSREGSSKVPEPFCLSWASLGPWEEPLSEPQCTNLCWNFIIYSCQTPGSCFLCLHGQHCACSVLNWMQLLKLNFESPDFAHLWLPHPSVFS